MVSVWGVFNFYSHYGDHSRLVAIMDDYEKAASLAMTLNKKTNGDGYDVLGLSLGEIDAYDERILDAHELDYIS